jgi:molybdopterin molybdotransferase
VRQSTSVVVVPANAQGDVRWLPKWRRVVHHHAMIPTQRLPASLTPLDVALAAVLEGLEPVEATALPLAEALGCVAAGMPTLNGHPPHDIAASDGWAMRARDLVGASSYSPLPLTKSPVWVEAGDVMPDACDCVVDADSVDQTGAMVQALAEAIPGQGVRRLGGDIGPGHSVIAPGQSIRPLDLLIARTAGLQQLNVRQPILRIVNIAANSADAATAPLIAECARAAGVAVIFTETAARDPASIAAARDPAAGDRMISAHGIALQPGRTSAVGRIWKIPVIALPGAPDQALAGWWTLALPALDRLSGRQKRKPVTLPLARKIASSVGVAEIALLERHDGGWMPLAVGELALTTIARADAWLAVPGSSEGFAAGTPVDAYILRD